MESDLENWNLEEPRPWQEPHQWDHHHQWEQERQLSHKDWVIERGIYTQAPGERVRLITRESQVSLMELIILE